MNRRLIAIISVFAFAASLIVVYGQSSTNIRSALPEGSVGRYQVIASDIDSQGMGGNLKQKTAIRIDTQTGKTWHLVELPGKEGGSNFYWEELSELRH
ncbi:exported hypothetical protein [Candidatus Sulfotelmatobacter sp. SbA7]|nr:exported hypothetical protein [Candidatus Sulfotelmatobacter sp. SbA7]